MSLVNVLMSDKIPENREENKVISPCCLHIALRMENGGMEMGNGNENRGTLLFVMNITVVMFYKIPENREENKIISPCCLHIALKAGTGNGRKLADNGNGEQQRGTKVTRFQLFGQGNSQSLTKF